MTNDPLLSSILDDLYALDPTLRAHEDSLKTLIARLRAERPDFAVDPQFVRELRSLLLTRADALSPSPSFFSFFAMPKLSYTLTGLLVGVLLAGPATYFLSRDSSLFPQSDTPLFSYSVRETDEKAFGSLSTADPQNAVAERGTSMGAGGMGNIALDRPQSGGGGGSPSIDSKMIAPGYFYQYQYTYSGSFPTLPSPTVDVLKREKDRKHISFSSILSHFTTSFIDLGSFGNSSVDTITVSQNVPKGYIITLMLREGMLSISQQWELWPQPEQNCRDEACWQRYRLQIGDVPADDVLVGIANDFVKKHGIDLSKYGTPAVDSQWRRDYDRTPNKADAWVPDIQRVIYPFLVEGKPVYEEGGAISGISVGVNIREKAVTEVWGIMDQTYLSSAYDAVTDEALIKKYIESIDRFQYPIDTLAQGTDKKTVQVHLGAPELSYGKFFLFRDPAKPGEELLVPALVFPVTRVDGDGTVYFWRQSIVVPLAKELLEERINGMNGGMGGGAAEAMPLTR